MTNSNIISEREKLSTDLHRPTYHYLPPRNWMNDPNGIIQWQGQYHLFYQHNPNGPLWGDMHWGHAVSSDLIHWADLPIALAPTPGGPDEAGCFSGCAVDNGVPTLIYTGTRGEKNEIQTQCIATSSDDLLTWQKYENNPVLQQVPSESGQTRNFRDPFVWQEQGIWYMALGSQIVGVGGTVFLYRSKNLVEWEYLNPLMVGDIRRNGVVWECPNFFRLGDRWVLIVSAHTGISTATVLYFVGTYENYRFTPISEGVLDYGCLYAPLTLVDNQNRRLLFGWLREMRSDREQQLAGWSGVQSIPRVLTLDSQNRLVMSPVPELEAVRTKHHQLYDINLEGNISLDVRGAALDIQAEFEAQPDGSCGICLLCSSNTEEHIEIKYDALSQQLIIRRLSPEMGGAVAEHVQNVPHALINSEPLRLRILLDGSVVEIIANARTSLTTRVYPRDTDSQHVQIFGSRGHLKSLDIWEMSSIWQ